VCSIRLSHRAVNLCFVSKLSGNLDTYLMKVEVLNILFHTQVNLVICGDFNVNFMSNNTNIKFYPYYDCTIWITL
jgi:hypothetical protein